MIALHRLGARAAAGLIARRELRCEDLVRACLERIAAREPVVGAWAWYEPERVIAQARRLDAGAPQGLLHGIPFGVKDVIDTADLPTQYGSSIYDGHRPAWDAACVAMARNAGALLLGKTVTAELATPRPGKTANPHDPRHTPGGSSSGSAAAVADGMVPLALGTQTGGSTIRPASYCGIVGCKPSAGVINRSGVKPVSESLDTVGVMARSPDDAALFLAAVTGRAALASVVATRPARVGVWRGPEWRFALPESIAAVEAAAQSLRAGGCIVGDVVVPRRFDDVAAVHHDIECFELARAVAFEYTHKRELLSEAIQGLIRHGVACPPERYDAALATARGCAADLCAVFDDWDVLLTASAPGEAPPGLAKTGEAVFNRPWTMLGVPVVTLPGFRGPRALPVGVQLIGQRAADAALLAAAMWASERLPQAPVPPDA